jgi:hypothetical protein
VTQSHAALGELFHRRDVAHRIPGGVIHQL